MMDSKSSLEAAVAAAVADLGGLAEWATAEGGFGSGSGIAKEDGDIASAAAGKEVATIRAAKYEENSTLSEERSSSSSSSSHADVVAKKGKECTTTKKKMRKRKQAHLAASRAEVIKPKFKSSVERLSRSYTSAYRGVTWNKNDRKWLVKISVKGKTRYVGNYRDEIEAAKAFDAAAREIRGDKAKVNFPLNKIEKDQSKYSSKFRGVSWHKGHNKWRAEVRVEGKKVYLGHYTNEAEAALAYDLYVAKVKRVAQEHSA